MAKSSPAGDGRIDETPFTLEIKHEGPKALNVRTPITRFYEAISTTNALGQWLLKHADQAQADSDAARVRCLLAAADSLHAAGQTLNELAREEP
jgi:hypothetical protein